MKKYSYYPFLLNKKVFTNLNVNVMFKCKSFFTFKLTAITFVPTEAFIIWSLTYPVN